MGKRIGSIEEESTRQIKLGALISYGGIIFNVLSGLLYTPWMIQQIGQTNFGLYTLAISLISILVIDFGLGTAVSRFISKFNAEKKQDSINNMLGITYKLYLLIDLIIFSVLVIVYFNLNQIYSEMTPNELSNFRVVYIIAAVYSLISFPFITLNGILTSYEKFIQLKLCDFINKLISIALIILALINDYGLFALVTANAVSGIFTILLKLLIVKKNTPIKINFKFSSKLMVKEIFSFSAWSAVVSIAQRFIFNITPTILGAVSSSLNIALFGIAMALEGYVYMIADAINGLFLPKVTRVVKNENALENLLNLMIKIGRLQLCIIGIITIGFISLGKDFILLWVGVDYTYSYYSAILLIIPSLIYLPQQIANSAIVALNKVRLQAYIFITMAIVNVILSLIFSSMWGVIGASLAICISYFIRSIGLNILYYREMKLNIFKYFKECHIKLSIPLLLSLLISLGINSYFTEISWINLFIKGILVILSFSIIIWLFGLNKYEKELIGTTSKRIINKMKRRGGL